MVLHLKHTSNPGLAQMNALNWDLWSTFEVDSKNFSSGHSLIGALENCSMSDFLLGVKISFKSGSNGERPERLRTSQNSRHWL